MDTLGRLIKTPPPRRQNSSYLRGGFYLVQKIQRMNIEVVHFISTQDCIIRGYQD